MHERLSVETIRCKLLDAVLAHGDWKASLSIQLGVDLWLDGFRSVRTLQVVGVPVQSTV